MFSLQLSLTNFTTLLNLNQYQLQETITLRYGPLQTQISISNGCGGKKLMFEMHTRELENLFASYACGLFIKNQHGKFFCILNLQNLQIGGSIEDFLICFFDDQRRNSYQAKLSLFLNDYQPRIPKGVNLMAKQNSNCRNFVNMVKEISQKNYEKPTINSFLYGSKKDAKNSNYQNPNNVLKEMVPPKIPINSNNLNRRNNPIPEINSRKSRSQSKSRNKANYQNNVQYKVTRYQPEDNKLDDNDTNPPVMQFTNQGDEQIRNVQKLQINNVAKIVNPVINIDDLRTRPNNRQNGIADNRQNMQNQFVTHSEQDSFHARALIGQFSTSDQRNFTKSQQQKRNFQKNKQKSMQPAQNAQTLNVPKPTKQSKFQQEQRQQLKKLASQHAKEQQKNNVMIPIYNEHGYKLIPLSSLSKEQIISYVRKQKQFEQNNRRNKQVNQKEKNVRHKTPDKYLQYDKQKHHHFTNGNIRQSHNHVPHSNSKRPQSAHPAGGSSRKISVQHSIKEEELHYQSENYDEDYQSDFESMSVANSAIKSHSWKKQNYAIDQSINDEGYSQDFDSYSQSMLSKTHQKPHSVSEIGESIRSISQSFRAK